MSRNETRYLNSEINMHGVGWNPDIELAFKAVQDIRTSEKISNSFAFEDVVDYINTHSDIINHPVSLREAKLYSRTHGVTADGSIFAIPLFHNTPYETVEGKVFVEFNNQAEEDMDAAINLAIKFYLSNKGFGNFYLGHTIVSKFTPENPEFEDTCVIYNTDEVAPRYAIVNNSTGLFETVNGKQTFASYKCAAEARLLIPIIKSLKNPQSHSIVELGIRSTNTIQVASANYDFKASLYKKEQSPSAWYFFTV